MSSEPPKSTRAADDDLTAKARIRNAAFELHAEKGEANTTVREVAQVAGVTHGLVVHHFGTKEGLHRAVLQYVIDLMQEALSTAPLEGDALEVGSARDASVARLYEAKPSFLPYLRRALLDPSETDTELMNMLADFTLMQVKQLRAEGISTSNLPMQNQALAVLLRELGPRLLEPVVQQIWHRLTNSTTPAPDIEIKVKSDDAG